MEYPIRRRDPVSEGTVVCILAIGLDRPIGTAGARLPGRRQTRQRCGRRGGARLPLRPLRRRPRPVARRSWRVAEVLRIPEELEVRLMTRPAPRRAPTARLVVGIALLVVAAVSPGAALAAVVLAALAAASRALWTYLDREFVRQWRLAAWTLTPCALFWIWLATQLR